MKALDYILTLTCIKHLTISSGDMALWEKVIVIEPDDLGSVPGTCMVDGEIEFSHVL